MNPRHGVVVIGAGIGGLAAAIRLARRGCEVHVIEAGASVGGLASGLSLDGFDFDAGPYVLLDRPGLAWAFEQLGLDLEAEIALRRLDEVYQVLSDDGACVTLYDSLERTADQFDRQWPGQGKFYRQFVQDTGRLYHLLEPLQRVSRPGVWELARHGAWPAIPFLTRSLGRVLGRTCLPQPVRDALAIWTHVAGQKAAEAPSPMAFVPAIIHRYGAFAPVGGIRSIADALWRHAQALGVRFSFNLPVTAIRTHLGKVSGVETADGTVLPTDQVVSNAHGLGTYLELLPPLPRKARTWLMRLPLQSPGVCAYLAVRGRPGPSYLRFRLPGDGGLCRLRVAPGALAPPGEQDLWQPMRLIAPMDHAEAERLGEPGQEDYLDHVLAETWWREDIAEFRVLKRHTPASWGGRYRLYRQSMNPVMTARFMRAGRLAHRSPYVRGLYLAGSSTHPGQWVSFCTISGILAADLLLEDRR